MREKDRNIDMHKRNIERKKTRMKWSSRKRRATWTIWCPSTSNIKTRQQRHIMPHIFLRPFEAFKLFFVVNRSISTTSVWTPDDSNAGFLLGYSRNLLDNSLHAIICWYQWHKMKSNEINSSLEYIPSKRGILISDILEVSEFVRYQGRIFDAAETLAHMRSDAPRRGTWIQPRKKASSTRRRASMTWSLRRRSGRYWSRRVIRATTVERQHVGPCRLRSIELADDLHSRWRNSHQCQQFLPNSLFPHYSHCRRQTGFKEIPSLALTGASLLQYRWSWRFLSLVYHGLKMTILSPPSPPTKFRIRHRTEKRDGNSVPCVRLSDRFSQLDNGWRLVDRPMKDCSKSLNGR